MKQMYGMYSDAGASMVQSLIDRISVIPITEDEDDIHDMLRVGFDEIVEAGHTEVWDTDVREQVVGTVERLTHRELSIFF